ncbi:MAG TPA: alpha/beta hydrolase [Pseudonocardia sp.]|nr:alpha/beta hydrolase [Pseudonocardia sp.]
MPRDPVLDGPPTHRSIEVGSIELHIAEQGSGPAVIMCHGFPGLWYSWRHQLPALAAAGYRAIAPDMRGYGRSGAPADPHAYDRASTVADLVGLLDALGLDDAVFVGHDFGAVLTWDLPQWAAGRVRALIQLSVPRTRTPPVPPSVAFAQVAAKHFFHMHYFQRPGPADEELGRDPARFLRAIFWALSGANRYLDVFTHPSEGRGYLDVLPEPPAPPWAWLSEAELDHYAREFTRTGFTGGLNWYRAADRVWHEKQHRPDRPVGVPTTFITGARDPVLALSGPNPFGVMRETVPGLAGVHVIPDVGHFVQLEAAARVNELMLEFLRTLP